MNALFVPIDVEAHVTNRENPDHKRIAELTPNFAELYYETLGGKVERQPFDIGRVLEAGVHLHFILPDALTQGDEENGYRHIPNRWLVTRIVSGKTFRVKCFVVESDYLGSSSKEGVPVPLFGGEEVYEDPPYGYLGRQYPLGSQPKPGRVYGGLTALGYGDPAFSAYYPGCRSVLGLYDDLADAPSECALTYTVAGWYEGGAVDPLRNATEDTFAGILDALAWDAGKSKVKNETICHGIVTGIEWKGKASPYPSGEPKGLVEVAVGNTSDEALAALIAAKAGGSGAEALERFLLALQYDLLNEFTDVDKGPAYVQDSIHRNAFTEADGGLRWIIRRTDKPGDVQLPKGIGVPLDMLNRKQRVLDALQAERLFWLGKMHTTWYGYMLCHEEGRPGKEAPSIEAFTDEITRLASIADDITDESEILNGEISFISDEINKKIDKDKAKGFYILEAEPRERFYAPNDPVVLLAGDGVGRGFLFGEDSRYDPVNGRLKCRDTLVHGISGKTGGKEVIITINEILGFFADLPDKASQFLWLSGLLCETACLAPSLSVEIANTYNLAYVKPVGDIPCPIAVNPWSQPWNTLFFSWEIQYRATRTDSGDDNTMKNWAQGEIDYSYKGGLPTAFHRYGGNSVLTPHSAKLLSDRLTKYAGTVTDPEMKKTLDMLAGIIKDLKVLSQSFGGQREWLLSRRHAMELPRLPFKGDSLTELVNRYLSIPAGPDCLTPAPDFPFFPVRGGFVNIGEMVSVNTFGGRQLLGTAVNNVYVSEMLRADIPGNIAQLPPRFTQFARLGFSWLSVMNETVESNADPDTTPVCGFIIPNILNKGLMVYDMDGSFKGTLKLAYEGEKTVARWVSAPSRKLRVFEDEEFSNRHLRDFIAGILSHNKEGGAFQAFLAALDQRLDSSINESDVYGEPLSAIWGRTLVLARASLNLELMTPPEYSMSYNDLGANHTGGFEKIRFNTLIGDAARVRDSLAGYFAQKTGTAEDYKTFCPAASSVPTKYSSAYVDYKKQNTLSASDKEASVFTMLMEPGASFVMRTGILPVKTALLPPVYVAGAMSGIRMAFEINPVLAGTENPCIPLPDEPGVEWEWWVRTKDGYQAYRDIMPAKGIFAEQPVLMDGYLVSGEGEKP
ncbi:MAG: hypothetical protein FWE91_07125 [Defluviitaleaceae bacterium]|nr:hypothetical protein [Defluviitaleaceae bacterium]